jgi:hypothetical protein
MGIPYTPDDAVTRSSEAIDTLHAVKGSAATGKPACRRSADVPARTAYLSCRRLSLAGHGLAGQKEMLSRAPRVDPGTQQAAARRRAKRRARRVAISDIDVAGCLLTLVGDTRLDALSRDASLSLPVEHPFRRP